ncbi:aspartyl/asparaginyl beta-hydroxylase domain-containing protein [Pedobacter sp. AW1-32]|uniref:aspartyl/asparaginyl beta-hydroxylase domain-containing protein n=1 Tax=Pedobacter sp. AW1-32 TaxID=3383026 RepID=UPI003FEE21C1
MISYSKLNLNINIHSLQEELKDLLAGNKWLPHYSTADYEGNWHVLPLRTPGGKSDAPFADLLQHGQFEDTKLLRALPYTCELLELLKCEKGSIRLLNLRSGSIIKAHRDVELSFEQGEARLHIPIFTNPDVEFYVQEDRVIMEQGEVWYINANIQHRVKNQGSTDRIHLVIDCKVNEWLSETIIGGNKKTVFVKKDPITTRQIIDSLKTIDSSYSNELANQMEIELKNNQMISKMLDFIAEIGLQYQLEKIDGDTFLPGLKIRNGVLIIDCIKLLYPGDILHEAGHLACMPLEIRCNMNDSLPVDDINNGGEMMAIAWSYAVSLHLGIDPHIVFHENGYKGGGQNLVDNFNRGNFFGVPLLQWNGMAYPPDKESHLSFPKMLSWTCKENKYTNTTIER